MSSAKTYIQSIIGAVETLGYTFTDEYFDFETLPVSGDDDIYRIEARTGEVHGLSGSRVEKKKEFDIWVAFKIPAANRKTETYNVLDAKEDLEDDIMNAVSGIQVRIVENIMSGIQSDYIIVKLTGEFIYWRDLGV